MQQNHLIHTITLDLKLDSGDTSFEHANEIVDDYKKGILETITNYFDGLEIDEYVLIDDLQIQLEGIGSLEQLKGKLEHQLRSNFETYLVDASIITNSSDKGRLEKGEEQSFPVLEDILFFLERGEFRWEYHKELFRIEEKKKVMGNILREYFQDQTAEEFLQDMLASPNAISRILYYFPQLKQLLLSLLIPQWYSLSESAYIFIKEQLEGQFFSLIKIGNTSAVIACLEILTIVHKEKDKTYFLISLLSLLDNVNVINKLVDFRSKAKLELVIASLSPKRLQSIVAILNKRYSINLSAEEVRLYLRILTEGPGLSKIDEIVKDSVLSEVDTDENTVISFKYCGIIFLHPYLNELFNAFNLLESKGFKNIEAQIKAVYLLNYLATYQTESEEEDFQFFKLLVGLDSELFIVPNFDLNDEEKQTCKHILEKLVEEWSILKSTSIKTVQRNFLQRRGIIKIEDKTIDIYLERSAFDILLDHFPYNYSLIKLRWFDKLICIIL